LQQFDTSLTIGCFFEPRPQPGERAFAKVDTDDTVDGFLANNSNEKVTIAAAEIEYRSRMAVADHIPYGHEALFV